MEDNKKYYVKLPGRTQGETWDADKFARNEAALMEKHPDVEVMESTLYDPSDNDIQDGDEYTIHRKGFADSATWDADKFRRNRDQLIAKYPDAEITRRRKYVSPASQQTQPAAEPQQMEDDPVMQKPDGDAPLTWQEALRMKRNAQGIVADTQKAMDNAPKAPTMKDVAESVDETPEEAVMKQYAYTDSIRPHYKSEEEIAAMTPEEKAKYDFDIAEHEQMYEDYQQAREQYKTYSNVKAIQKEIDRLEAERKKPGADKDVIDEQIRMKREEMAGITAPLYGEQIDALQERIDIIEGMFTVNEVRAKNGDPTRTMSDIERKNYELAQSLLVDAQSVYGRGVKGQDDNWAKTMGKTFMENMSDPDYWKQFFFGDKDSMAVRRVLEKMERGEVLASSEQAVYEAFMSKTAAEVDRMYDTAKGTNAGKVVADMLPFVVEMALTKGLRMKATDKMVSKMRDTLAGLVRNTSGAAAKKAVDLTGRYAISLANRLAQSAVAAAVAPSTTRAVGEKLLEMNPDGTLKYSRAGAVALGFANNAKEYFTEMMGEELAPIVGDIVKASGVTKVFDKYIGNSISDFAKKYSKVAAAGKFAYNTGWNGLGGELLEEVEGAAIDELIFGQEGAWQDFWKRENLFEMIAGFLPMTILGAGANVAQMASENRNLGGLNRAEADLKEAYRALGWSDAEWKSYFIGMRNNARTASPKRVAEQMAYLSDQLMQKAGELQPYQAEEMLSTAAQYERNLVTYYTYMGQQAAKDEVAKEAKRAELEQSLGRQYWSTDDKGNEVVRLVTTADGQTGYLLESSEDTGEGAILIPGEGLRFVDEFGTVDVQEQKHDDYLAGLVQRQKATDMSRRMNAEAREKANAVLSQIAVGETELDFGTDGIPVKGVVVDITPDGVLVEFPQAVNMHGQMNKVHRFSLAEVGKALPDPVDMNVYSDSELADMKEASDAVNSGSALRDSLNKRYKRKQFVHNGKTWTFKKIHKLPVKNEAGEDVVWVSARGEGNTYAELPVRVSELDNAPELGQPLEQKGSVMLDTKGNPVPMTVDKKGNKTVDGGRLWEQDKIAWTQWNDERRGDMGLDSRRKITNTYLPAYQAERAELEAQLDKTMNDEERDAIYEKIQALDSHIAEAQSILDGYAERDVQQAMEREAIKQKAQQELEAKRIEGMQIYVDSIADIPAQVVSMESVLGIMDQDNCSAKEITEVRNALEKIRRKSQEEGKEYTMNGFHANGKIYIFVEGNNSAARVRQTYFHERQHEINERTPELVQKAKEAFGNDRDMLDSVVEKLSGTEFYKGKNIENLADEILAFSLERAYVGIDMAADLRKAGAPEEYITFVTDIYGQQTADSYSLPEKRDGIRNAVNNSVTGSGQDGTDQEPGSEQMDGRLGADGGSGEAVEEVSEESRRLREIGVTVGLDNLIMDDNQRVLKQETGYLTPVERNDVDGLMFSVTTIDPWKKNYVSLPGNEKRVADAIINFAQRLVANEIVNGVVSHGEYKQSGFGPLRSNIEYVVTFDMDTTCPRTFQYLNYVKKIEGRIGRPLSTTESVQLIEMMRVYGQMIPCVYCYSENSRQAMKQYMSNYLEARRAVISANTDEEALQYMYGRDEKALAEGKGAEDVLTAAGLKVFKEWRKMHGKGYNPNMKTLFYHYNDSRNSILSYLDMKLNDGEISAKAKDEDLVVLLSAEFNIGDKGAKVTIANIVSEWKWDATENREHKDYDPVDEDDMWLNEDALSVWDAMTKYGSSATNAHNIERYVPYTDELKKLTPEQRDYINGMGGLRMHSTNDFRIDYVLDYFQFMADMAANGMKGHTYTKSPEFVRIFGNSGYKINMSIAAYEDEQGNVHMNKEEGFDWDEAKELRGYFPHAGVMLMATSDAQIQLALDSDWIDMFIPFHRSDMPTRLWYNMRYWTDYQSKQNEKFYNADDKKAILAELGVELPKKISADELDRIFVEKTGVKRIYVKDSKNKGKLVRPHFLPDDTIVEGELVPGHHNDVELYRQLCSQYGVHPRFYGVKVKDNTPEGQGREVDITEHPAYIKCVKETSRVYCASTPNEAPQVPIQFNFDQPSEALGGRTPMDYAFAELEARALKETELAGKPVNDIYESYKRDDWGIVDEFISGVIRKSEELGKELPVDYLTPKTVQFWNDERNEITRHLADFKGIPYHRNEYDEQGNLVSGRGLDFEKVDEKVPTKEAKRAAERTAMDWMRRNGQVQMSVTAAQDAEYMDAVNAGDMEKAQQMVKAAFKNAYPDTKVVDENGEPLVVYHAGTFGDRYNFTANGLMHFGTKQAALDRFRGKVNDWFWYVDGGILRKDGKYGWDIPSLYDFFGDGDPELSLYEKLYNEQPGYDTAAEAQEAGENALGQINPKYKAIIDGLRNGEINDAAAKYMNMRLSPVFLDIKNPQRVEDMGDDWRSISREAGVDGYVYENEYEDPGEDSYVAFNPNQIKSADPVTYDNDGNVIPLSQRFNPAEDDIRFSVTPQELDEGVVSFRVLDASSIETEDDRRALEAFEKGEVTKVYRGMQRVNIDGVDYALPPMAAKIDGEWVLGLRIYDDGRLEPTILRADEHPELADSKGRFKLDKGNGKSLPAAYNPYWHVGAGMLNDQFAEAQDRDNLITVEGYVPNFILERSGKDAYKAKKAKDGEGWHDWKAGIIQGQLSGTRKVALSRYFQGGRVVPDSEVAQNIFNEINGKVDYMPSNVVPPAVRAELEALGVQFIETDNQNKIIGGEHAGDQFTWWYNNGADQRRADKFKERSKDAGKTLAGWLEENGRTGQVDSKTVEKYDRNLERTAARKGISLDEYLKSREKKTSDEDETMFSVTELPFLQNLKAKSAANMFKTWALDELDPEIEDYVRSNKAVAEEFAHGMDATPDEIYDYLNSLSRDEYNRATAIKAYRDFPTYDQFHSDDIDFIKGECEEFSQEIVGKIADARLSDEKWLKENMPELVDAVEYKSGDNVMSPDEVRAMLDLGDEAGIDTGNFTINTDKLSNVQFSVSAERDKEFADAYKRGDEETASRMVREAFKAAYPNTKVVDENGELIVVYHGTPRKNFNAFNEKAIGSETDEGSWGEGFYFYNEDAYDLAEFYASGSHDIGSWDGTKGKGRIINAYLNFQNPYIIDSEEKANQLVADAQILSDSYPKGVKIWIEQNGYDGIIAKPTEYDNTEYVAFSPAHIKSAEPFTFDDNGELIPLSKRFDSENDDIRFSVSDADYQKAVESGNYKKVEKMLKQAAKESMPNTKVVDKKGNPMLVYHGTPSEDFNVFSGDYLFFTKDISNAREYEAKRTLMGPRYSRSGHTVPVFLNIENPLELDVHGGWTRISRNMVYDALGIPYEKEYTEKTNKWGDTYTVQKDEQIITDEVCRLAKEKGYDGIIFRNLSDHVWNDDYRQTDVFVAFSPNQVKGVGTTYDEREGFFGLMNRYIKDTYGPTYDDNGNLIPLSQRFDASKDDIRFSVTPQQDVDYLAAVEAGDMDKAQAMVDEAAKAAGYDTKLFHGTFENFNEFKPNEWSTEVDGKTKVVGFFSNSKDYSENGYGPARQYYVKLGKILDMSGVRTPSEWIEYLKQKGVDNIVLDSAVTGKDGYPMDSAIGGDKRDNGEVEYLAYEILDGSVNRYWNGDGNLSSAISDAGFDSIMFPEGNEGEITYAILGSNQIKSADPVAYDDNGNVIPLGDRFNPSEDDIRFSVGYHAGDLGKARDTYRENMFGRSTGHFGTGTYFVGDEAKINYGQYAERPHHKVDLDKYKLYKPLNAQQGIELHNALKHLMGYVIYPAELPQSMDEYLNILGRLIDIKYESPIDMDALRKLAAPLIGEERYDRIVKKEMDDFDDKELAAQFIVDDVRVAMKEDDGLYNPSLRNRIRWGTDIDRDAFKLFINGVAPSTQAAKDAFDKARSIYRSEGAEVGGRQDSFQTIVMKELGWEGVDVTGIRELDNTTYGSVVYDLRAEDKELVNFSVNDAGQSLRLTDIHDQVEAGGLGSVIPEKGDRFMDLYAELPEEIRSRVTDDAIRNGGHFADSTEYILSDIAGKNDLSEVENTAIEAARRMLEQQLGRQIPTDDARWMLYNNVHRDDSDIFDIAHNITVADMLGFSPDKMRTKRDLDEAVRFREVLAAQDQSAVDIYSTSLGVRAAIDEALHDQFISAQKMVEAIEKKTGRKTESFENIMLAMNQLSSKNFADKEKYIREFLAPMWDAIRSIVAFDPDASLDTVIKYVQLKHGLERNDVFARRDARAYYKEWRERIAKMVSDRTAASLIAELNDVETKQDEARDAGDNAEVARLGKRRKDLLDAIDYSKKGIDALDSDYDAYLEQLEQEDCQNPQYLKNREKDYSGVMAWFYEDMPQPRRKIGEGRETYRRRLIAGRKYKYDNLKDAEDAAQDFIHLCEVYWEVSPDRLDRYNGKKGVVKTTSQPQFMKTNASGVQVFSLSDLLWSRINAATKETLRHQRDAGVISRASYNALEKMFKFYVPLRGFKEDSAEDVYAYYNSGANSDFSAPVLSAKGRRSVADNPFGCIGQMAESGIQQDNKNKAKQALYYFVSNREGNGLAEISKCWFEDTGRKDAAGRTIWEKHYPAITADMDQDAIDKAWQDLADEMQAKKDMGVKVKYGQAELDLKDSVVHINDRSIPEHFVRVKVGGKDYDIIVNGSPRAAQAINGALNVEADPGMLRKILMAVTRMFSAFATSLNPEFGINNFFRDMQYADLTTLADYGPEFSAKYHANLTRILHGLRIFRLASAYRTDANKRDAMAADGKQFLIDKNQPELVEAWREYVENGGPTGFTVLTNNKEYDRKLDDYLNTQLSSRGVKAIKEGFQWMSETMETIEQVARFAAFLTARETGHGMLESINAAKEVTLNFNRKGSGLVIGKEDMKSFTFSDNPAYAAVQKSFVFALSCFGQLRTLMMFFNAVVQSLVRYVKLWINAPGAMALNAAWNITLGTALSLLHAAWADGDDDDEYKCDYLDLPTYERRANIMIGVGNRKAARNGKREHGIFVKIPISQELVPYFALGDIIATELILKRYPNREPLAETAEAFGELLPLNPFTENPAREYGTAVAALAPAFDLLTNTNFYGSRIYPDSKWASEAEKQNAPKWESAFPRTADWAVTTAKALSNVTGGDEVVGGKVNWSPEVMQYLLEQTFKGTGTFLGKVADLPGIALGRTEFTWKRIPFLSRLLTDTGERQSNAYVSEEYRFFTRELFPEMARQEKEYAELGKGKTDEEKAAKLEELKGQRSSLNRKAAAYKRRRDENKVPGELEALLQQVETLNAQIQDLEMEMAASYVPEKTRNSAGYRLYQEQKRNLVNVNGQYLPREVADRKKEVSSGKSEYGKTLSEQEIEKLKGEIELLYPRWTYEMVERYNELEKQ